MGELYIAHNSWKRCVVSPSSEIITLVRMTRTTAKAETTKRKMVIGKNTNSSVRVTFSKLVRQTDLKREREKRQAKMIKYRDFMAILYESPRTNIFFLSDLHQPITIPYKILKL